MPYAPHVYLRVFDAMSPDEKEAVLAFVVEVFAAEVRAGRLPEPGGAEAAALRADQIVDDGERWRDEGVRDVMAVRSCWEVQASLERARRMN